MKSRRGITLIELLAALALSSLLVGSVLGVLSSITRAQKVVLAEHRIPETWQTQLDRLLAWDLENSRSIVFTETGFIMEGFAGRDLATRTPIHCPCVLHYEVVASADRKHLIRREIQPELLNLDNSLSELVCLDVGQILIGPPLITGVSAATTEQLSNGPIPNRVSIRLLASGEKKDAKLIYAKNFTLR